VACDPDPSGGALMRVLPDWDTARGGKHQVNAPTNNLTLVTAVIMLANTV